MSDRPSFDVSSDHFDLHPDSYRQPHEPHQLPKAASNDHFVDAADPEAQIPHQGHSDTHSIRSRRSLRSLISRRTHKSEVNHELKPIQEEESREDPLMEDDEEFLTDLKEAKLQDEGNSTAQEQFRKNARRHKVIQRYTRNSKSFTVLRRLYDDILSRTLITRSFIWWLPLALIFFIPLAVDAWGKAVLSLGNIRVMWIFIWLEVSWGALFVARQFAHYMPGILGFLVMIIAPRYFWIIDTLLALEIPVTIFFWLFVTFITFKPITATNPKARVGVDGSQQWQDVLQNVLVAFFLTGLFYLLEQLFIHTLSVSYHRTRMAQRIKLNKRSISIVSQLLYAAWGYFPYGCPEFTEEDRLLGSPMAAVGDKAGNKVKKILGNKIDVRRHFNTAARNLTPMQTLPLGFNGSEKDADKMTREALPNSTARQVLAERIWKSLVLEGHNELQMDDILEALGKERNEDSLYIFDLLDLDGEGSISLEEMTTAVRGIGKESRNISRALQDMDGVITKLHYLLLVLLAIIIIVIFVGMVAPSAATVLATLGTTILGFSFIFSGTCAEILSSCVFLFVKHPIDIGDIVQIDAGSLGHTRLIVREINLLTTVFEDGGSAAIRQAPNSVLNTLFIDNITRSPPQTVPINLVLGLPETNFELLEEFRRRIAGFLAEHPRDYSPGFFYQVTDFPDLDRLKLTVSVTLRNNQVDMEMFAMRRTRLYEFVSRCIHEVPLHIPRRDTKYNDPATPMYTQNVDHTMRTVERQRAGMERSGVSAQDMGRSTSIRRSDSNATQTTGRRKMVQGFQ